MYVYECMSVHPQNHKTHTLTHSLVVRNLDPLNIRQEHFLYWLLRLKIGQPVRIQDKKPTLPVLDPSALFDQKSLFVYIATQVFILWGCVWGQIYVYGKGFQDTSVDNLFVAHTHAHTRTHTHTHTRARARTHTHTHIHTRTHTHTHTCTHAHAHTHTCTHTCTHTHARTHTHTHTK